MPVCKASMVTRLESNPTIHSASPSCSSSTAWAAPTLVGSLNASSTLISGWVRSMSSVSRRALSASASVWIVATTSLRPLAVKVSTAPRSRAWPLALLIS